MSSMRMSQFYKTKMCPWYFKGRCERGLTCRFAHSDAELRKLPNLSRTSLCPNLMKHGTCMDSDRCRFAHSSTELRATDDLYKTSLCFLWMRGRCDAGDQCRHAHGVAELRSLPSAAAVSSTSLDEAAAQLQESLTSNGININTARTNHLVENGVTVYGEAVESGSKASGGMCRRQHRGMLPSATGAGGRAKVSSAEHNSRGVRNVQPASLGEGADFYVGRNNRSNQSGIVGNGNSGVFRRSGSGSTGFRRRWSGGQRASSQYSGQGSVPNMRTGGEGIDATRGVDPHLWTDLSSRLISTGLPLDQAAIAAAAEACGGDAATLMQLFQLSVAMRLSGVLPNNTIAGVDNFAVGEAAVVGSVPKFESAIGECHTVERTDNCLFESSDILRDANTKVPSCGQSSSASTHAAAVDFNSLVPPSIVDFAGSLWPSAAGDTQTPLEHHPPFISSASGIADCFETDPSSLKDNTMSGVSGIEGTCKDAQPRGPVLTTNSTESKSVDVEEFAAHPPPHTPQHPSALSQLSTVAGSRHTTTAFTDSGNEVPESPQRPHSSSTSSFCGSGDGECSWTSNRGADCPELAEQASFIFATPTPTTLSPPVASSTRWPFVASLNLRAHRSADRSPVDRLCLDGLRPSVVSSLRSRPSTSPRLPQSHRSSISHTAGTRHSSPRQAGSRAAGRDTFRPSTCDASHRLTTRSHGGCVQTHSSGSGEPNNLTNGMSHNSFPLHNLSTNIPHDYGNPQHHTYLRDQRLYVRCGCDGPPRQSISPSLRSDADGLGFSSSSSTTAGSAADLRVLVNSASTNKATKSRSCSLTTDCYDPCRSHSPSSPTLSPGDVISVCRGAMHAPVVPELSSCSLSPRPSTTTAKDSELLKPDVNVLQSLDAVQVPYTHREVSAALLSPGPSSFLDNASMTYRSKHSSSLSSEVSPLDVERRRLVDGRLPTLGLRRNSQPSLDDIDLLELQKPAICAAGSAERRARSVSPTVCLTLTRSASKDYSGKRWTLRDEGRDVYHTAPPLFAGMGVTGVESPERNAVGGVSVTGRPVVLGDGRLARVMHTGLDDQLTVGGQDTADCANDLKIDVDVAEGGRQAENREEEVFVEGSLNADSSLINTLIALLMESTPAVPPDEEGACALDPQMFPTDNTSPCLPPELAHTGVNTAAHRLNNLSSSNRSLFPSTGITPSLPHAPSKVPHVDLNGTLPGRLMDQPPFFSKDSCVPSSSVSTGILSPSLDASTDAFSTFTSPPSTLSSQSPKCFNPAVSQHNAASLASALSRILVDNAVNSLTLHHPASPLNDLCTSLSCTGGQGSSPRHGVPYEAFPSLNSAHFVSHQPNSLSSRPQLSTLAGQSKQCVLDPFAVDVHSRTRAASAPSGVEGQSTTGVGVSDDPAACKHHGGGAFALQL